MVLVTMFTSAPGSLDVLAATADVTIEGAVARPWKRWVEAEISEGGEACWGHTGAVMGIVLSGSILPKIGLWVGLKMLGAVEREEELDDAPAVTEILEYEQSLTSLLCTGPRTGLNAG